MAQYKVPQDVEADDKLIGPFSFRQFVYLLAAAGLLALMVGMFQLFPLLAIIPLPFALLFAALALPLKKDQPMETYLAAVVSYYLKPRKRIWVPGQSESTIEITAPKKVEENRTRDITSEEATHRLSFLVDIVDTGGYAIKGASTSPMKEELVAEANTVVDMFDDRRFNNLENEITKNEDARHEEVMREMRDAIEKSERMSLSGELEIKRDFGDGGEKSNTNLNVDVPTSMAVEKPVEKSVVTEKHNENDAKKVVKSSIIELANNTEFSVATIAKEANRINRKDEGEVFISLH